MKKRGRKDKGKRFWDKEYKTSSHLALSDNPSSDLMKFTRWLVREFGKTYLNTRMSVADLGCGNGRNLIYLSNTFGIHGFGFDISSEAIEQARQKGEGLPLEFTALSIAEPIPLPDNSQDMVLDMMTSHFLNEAQRKSLLDEITRILKPEGWLFFKTFLLDEDMHAARLLKSHPGNEPGTYIHPKMNVPEHVSTEEEIRERFDKYFFIHKIYKSHRHLIRGRANKRRSICVYAQKLS